MNIRIHPSILSADFANLEADIRRVANADAVHVDVMDGHFVPNLTLGEPIVRRLAAVSPLPLDVHLMIEDPDRWALAYADAGAHSVTFHAEAAVAPVRLARELRARGVSAGIALRPATPADSVIALLAEYDMVLVMTVEPGFGGQSLIEGTKAKVRELRQAIDRAGLPVDLQVDGGIAPGTIGAIATAGANVFVAGAAVFGTPDPGATVDHLRELGAAAQLREA